jgi:hypothetical protein
MKFAAHLRVAAFYRDAMQLPCAPRIHVVGDADDFLSPRSFGTQEIARRSS